MCSFKLVLASQYKRSFRMSSFSVVNLENASVQRIIHAALVSFGRRGFEGTSLNDIAREAQVSKSLLHYHFDSKEHLFLESQLGLLRALLSQLRDVTDESQYGLINIDVALEQVMSFLEHHLDQICLVLTFHNVAHRHPDVRRHLERFNREVNDLVVTAIHNTLGSHTERLIIPPARLARLLVTLFNGLIVDLAMAANDEARDLVHQTFDDIRMLFTQSILTEVV
jgi:AcrR family transcriptional regulator